MGADAARGDAPNGRADNRAAGPARRGGQLHREESDAVPRCGADPALEDEAEESVHFRAGDTRLAASEKIPGQSRVSGRGHLDYGRKLRFVFESGGVELRSDDRAARQRGGGRRAYQPGQIAAVAADL